MSRAARSASRPPGGDPPGAPGPSGTQGPPGAQKAPGSDNAVGAGSTATVRRWWWWGDGHGWAGFALAGLGGLAGALVLRFWVPPGGAADSICLLRRAFDLPCPGCGMTRAFAHLAKGEWSAALHDHPLAPALAAELGLLWTAWGVDLAGWRPSWLGRLGRPASPTTLELTLLAHLAVLVALWLGRAATGTLPW